MERASSWRFFASGSDILLDALENEIYELSTMPANSHSGQINHSELYFLYNFVYNQVNKSILVSDINDRNIRMRFHGRRLYSVRKSIMKNKGKKIVAVALSLVMMIPFAFRQTTVTKAAVVNSVKNALKFEVEENVADKTKGNNDKLSLERGQEVKLKIKADADMRIGSIKGKLTFEEKTSDGKKKENAIAGNKIFSIVGSDDNGWNIGYVPNDKKDYYDLTIGSDSATKTVKKDDVIATLYLESKTSVDWADVKYTVTLMRAFNTDENTTPISVAEGESEDNVIAISLKNDFATTRGVTLEMPTSIEQNVYTFKTDGTTDLKKFSVPVSIKQNTGFTGMTVQFTYDTNCLTYVGYKLSPQANVGLECKTVSAGVNNKGEGEVSLSFAGSEDVMIIGDFITLNFQISKDAQGGTATDIKGAILALENASENAFDKDKLKETSKVSCKVNLKKGCELGDVNMDTKISLVDATYILQYYNGVRELSDEQKALANVNKDGDINLVDVLLILKYCNGERGSF